MLQWIYLLRPVRPAMLTEGPTDEEATVLQAHVSHLQRLAAEGHVIIAGRTQTAGPETLGIVLFRAGSEVEAKALMESDPALKEAVMTASLFPYRIAVAGELRPADLESEPGA